MATLHPLFELLACLALLLTLPLTLELLLLSLAARLPGKEPPRPEPLGFPRALWAVVPAHNEEQLIGTCVRSLLASGHALAGVLVIAHNCTDATEEQAVHAGAYAATLQDSGAGGKGAALHFGFLEAFARGADAVLVVDADSTVTPGLAGAVRAQLAGGADAVQCRYLVAEADASPRTRLMSLAFLGMNLVRPLGRARLGLSSGLFGNGFALTQATVARVPYAAHSIVEDLEYPLLLLRAGLRVDFVENATVLGEMPHAAPAAATQRARWEGGRALMRRQWRLPLLNDALHGRWYILEPLLDLLSLPLAMQALVLLVSLLVPVFWLRVYGVAALLVLLLYVLVAASFAPSPRAALRALATAPGYMLWKLAMLPRTRLAARRQATWVRTERNQPGPGK